MTIPRFSLGSLVATPGALQVLADSGQVPSDFLSRHARGDWGDVDQEDWKLNNDAAVKDGSRILSSYVTLRGVKLWVITEAAGEHGFRSCTTILLPAEYYQRPGTGRGIVFPP